MILMLLYYEQEHQKHAPRPNGETYINCHEILLKHGADHYGKDNDGISPNEITRWNPRMQLLVEKYYKKNIK